MVDEADTQEDAAVSRQASSNRYETSLERCFESKTVVILEIW